MTARYAVIESTPGYMPDDDDPATFTDRREALRYMVRLVREYRDSFYPINDFGGWLDREAGCAFLVDEGRPHDLGRYFEIMECEES